MDNIVKDLKKLVNFKDTVAAGDIVLIAARKPQLLVYAMVTAIVRDETRRDEWWHVNMQILALPPQKVTWTLRKPQMTGLEIFTMDGEERFMKAVDFGSTTSGTDPRKQKTDRESTGGLRRVK